MQQTSVAVKENWQRYCIPSTNASQLSAECGSVERATLPKIGKMVKGNNASSFMQTQVCTAGKAGLAPGMQMGETGCLKVEQNSQQDKCFRKDSHAADNESVMHLSLPGSRQERSDVHGRGVAGLCNVRQSSGLQSLSTGTKAKNSGHGLSSFGVPEEHASRAMAVDHVGSKVGQIHEAGYESERPASRSAGPLCSNQMANIKQKHLPERSLHSKGDQKLNENGVLTDALVGGGVGMYHLQLMNCYHQSNPAAASRCSIPGNGSIQGLMAAAENHGYYSATETNSMPSCLGEGVSHSLISTPVSAGSRDLTSSGQLIPSGPPVTKSTCSTRGGPVSDSLGGALRSSSPRLSCRDDDGICILFLLRSMAVLIIFQLC